MYYKIYFTLVVNCNAVLDVEEVLITSVAKQSIIDVGSEFM